MSEVQERVAGNLVTSENLAEFTAKKLGLASDPAPAPEAKEPVEQETTSEPEAVEEAKEQEEPQKKPKEKLERRFSDLTRQREQARREAAEERQRREELEAKLREFEARSKPQQAPSADEKPRPDQFADAFEYAEKLAEWSANQALKNREKAEAERKQQEERNRTIQSWQKKLAAAKAELPDFDDMVASSEVMVSDPIRDAIIESDVGPKLLYHFAENPELAEKLNGMSVASALREIGRLEARFEKAEKPVVPVAPRPKAAQPINPIRGVAAGIESGVDSDGEFRGNFQAYRAARLAGKIR